VCVCVCFVGVCKCLRPCPHRVRLNRFDSLSESGNRCPTTGCGTPLTSPSALRTSGQRQPTGGGKGHRRTLRRRRVAYASPFRVCQSAKVPCSILCLAAHGGNAGHRLATTPRSADSCLPPPTRVLTATRFSARSRARRARRISLHCSASVRPAVAVVSCTAAAP
jgi:hypothetical protein